MKTILLISPYWKEEHRWMVSSVKLAELWQRLGYRVIAVCMGHQRGMLPAHGPHARVTIEKVTETLEIHRVKDIFLKDPWNYGIAFGFSGYVRRLAEATKPDVIAVNKVLFWSSISLIRLRLAGHRVLLLTDALVGVTWWPRPALAKIGAAIYAWTLGWIILKAATRIVFFHPQPTHILRKLGIQQKSVIIPTGIDPSKYHPESKVQHETLIATYVGRLESVKGADDFLVAAVKARKEFPNLTAQVVGWYQEENPLVNTYRNDVTFTGLRDDIPGILESTDIFVLPSYSEGLSNALMEAMASGCACIASDVGGNRFLIQNGVSGFLFPAGDREALASHIRRLVQDPAKRTSLGENARKRIEEHFSWKKIGEEYRKLFESWTAKGDSA